MKRVVFSFDDGRLDTYTKAYQIMKKYGVHFTINVTTDFVFHQENYTNFKSADNKSMSVDQILECYQNGIEIACHGHTHQNTKEDVLDNISMLSKIGIDVEGVGFASPNSEVTKDNCFDIKGLLAENKIGYIRSGCQVRREGLIYSFLTVMERITHSKVLFWQLNKKNIVLKRQNGILMSVAITAKTTLKQILYLVKKLKDEQSVILMFHSILNKEDVGYGKDLWYYDELTFEKLISQLNSNKDIKICTTKEMLKNTN